MRRKKFQATCLFMYKDGHRTDGLRMVHSIFFSYNCEKTLLRRFQQDGIIVPERNVIQTWDSLTESDPMKKSENVTQYYFPK